MKKNNTAGYITIMALLSITSILSLNLFFHEKTSHDKVNVGVFPYRVGDWEGKDIEVSESDYRILETRNLVLRQYVNPSNESLLLFIVYSETNRAVFHPPEVCLIGSGSTIVDKRVEKIGVGRYSFSTNKLYLEKNKSYKEMVLYCYKAGNLYAENFYLQQIYLAINQIFGRRIPGATIRVSMQMGESENATLATLKSFLAETVKIVDTLK